jgi:hypothetical protein
VTRSLDDAIGVDAWVSEVGDQRCLTIQTKQRVTAHQHAMRAPSRAVLIVVTSMRPSEAQIAPRWRPSPAAACHARLRVPLGVARSPILSSLSRQLPVEPVPRAIPPQSPRARRGDHPIRSARWLPRACAPRAIATGSSWGIQQNRRVGGAGLGPAQPTRRSRDQIGGFRPALLPCTHSAQSNAFDGTKSGRTKPIAL